jgi:hypothetical protein
MQSILSRYSHLPGNRDLVFKSLCALLAENPLQIDWTEFGQQEWDLLDKLAVDEGVAAMAYYLLRSDPDINRLLAFDTQTYQALAEREAINAVRNAVLLRHLDSVLKVLNAQAIPVVLLKGADLARSLYPEPSLRVMTDLDLLVPQVRFKEALALVNALGYHEYLPEASPGLDHLLSHHAHLRKDSRIPTLLELHWALVATPAFRHAVSMDWFWENLEPVKNWHDKNPILEQNTVFTLDPTANLLYLTAHQMLQHGGERASLRWLLDLQRLIEQRRQQIDWEELVTQADHFGWSGALWAALDAVQACFATSLPEGLLSRLQAQVGEHDALVELKAETAPTRILGEWKKLRSLHWPGRLRLLIALVFPSPAYMRMRYQPRPAWIWPLYYIYRWVDIALDGLLTLLNIFHPPAK